LQFRINTRIGTGTFLAFVSLALLGEGPRVWADQPAEKAKPAETQAASNVDARSETDTQTPASKKQWVWLTKQNCWGYGYQLKEGPHAGKWVIDPGSKRKPAEQTAAEQPAGDPYGFLSWLNATRASVGLAAVGYDANLSAWAQVNNQQQNALGLGHHVMGPARRQNSAMGSAASIGAMWMSSPAHRAALLDPTIRAMGIAGLGAYWTFNAY
jgi:Cysteine-rich secretory protein family